MYKSFKVILVANAIPILQALAEEIEVPDIVPDIVQQTEEVRETTEASNASPVEENEEKEVSNEEEQKEEQKIEEQKDSELKINPEDIEEHNFGANTDRLLDIIIHSLYSDKEVFLRELISNASDALDKLRTLAVINPEIKDTNPNLDIQLSYDEEAKTISIQDSGIGMTKDDLITNLGTIAKSGTANFIEEYSKSKSSDLIGQFGVGFYAAFLVADKVQVISKNNDDDQYIWESQAGGSFNLVKDPRGDTLGRGTKIVLHIKPEDVNLLSEQKLKDIALKHSQFVPWPIKLRTKKEVEVEEEEKEEDEEKEEEDEDLDEDKSGEEEEKDEDEEKAIKPQKEKKKEIKYDMEQINEMKPLWNRKPDDVTDEEYKAFYKSIAHNDYQDPMTWTHFNAEGDIDFKSLLYIPQKNQYGGMFGAGGDDFHNKKADIKLYVRRVLVAEHSKTDDANDTGLLPRYLNFVKGLVDSDDLPLNVSREQLQQSRVMNVIKKKLIRKTLDMIKSLAKEEQEEEIEFAEEKEEEEQEEGEEKKEDKKSKKEKKSVFSKFYEAYGKHLKLGAIEDDSNRSKIVKLLKFATTHSEGKELFLDDYISRMNEKQETIYYASGDSADVINKLPSMQIFKKKNIEVLLLTDMLDEHVIQRMSDYSGKKLVSIQKADIKIDETDDEISRFQRMEKLYKPLTERWEKIASKHVGNGIKIDKVKISKTLVNGPCTVVAGANGQSPQQEKMMRAQAMNSQMEMMMMMQGGKTLEINGNHPVIYDLLKKINDNVKDESAKETIITMSQTAFMEAGFEIKDPSAIVKRVYRLMSQQLGVDPNAPVKEIELPEEEEEEEENADEESEETTDEKIEETTEEKTEEATTEEKTEEATTEEKTEETETTEEKTEEATTEEKTEETTTEEKTEETTPEEKTEETSETTEEKTEEDQCGCGHAHVEL